MSLARLDIVIGRDRKASMSTPRVWIIVLSWNQRELTRDCVKSLMCLDYPNYHVVVVDNDSRDGTVEELEVSFDGQIDLIVNSCNLGFAGGNNVGIRHALKQGADYVMLLNNDTKVDPGFLTPLVKVLETNAQIGAVTPKIYYMRDPERIWAAGGEICWWRGHARSRGQGSLDDGRYDRSEPVDYATGCCVLIARRVWQKVGELDERYFAYWEDADWCARARRIGFEIWYEPTSRIWHWAGGSSKRGLTSNWRGQKSPFRHYLATRNNIWFIRRHTNGATYLAAMMALVVRRLLFYSLGFIVLRRWRKLQCMWQGVCDGLLDDIDTDISGVVV